MSTATAPQVEAGRPEPRTDPAAPGRVDDTRRCRSRRDWAVDVTCFVLALAYGAVAVSGVLARPVPPPDWLVRLDLLAGVAACLALWVRRRWPVGIALALLPVAAFSDSSGGAVLIILFTVAVHRRWPTVAFVTALHLAVAPLYAWLRPDPELPFPVLVVLVVVFTSAVVAWGMLVGARRQLVLSLRERAWRAESEQRLRVEQARQTERTRIAREMHDVLAHRISLLSMHAGALEFRPDAPPAEVARAAGIIRESAHQALEDLREVIGVLRHQDGVGARPQPTLADLPALVEECRAAGVRVRLECRVADLAAVPDVTGRNAYRIAQEALTNARKHAPGAAVDLRVDGTTEGLVLEVRNRPPVGGAPAGASGGIPGGGTGLVGMAERASLAGGRLEHGPTPDGGFQLRAVLPCPT